MSIILKCATSKRCARNDARHRSSMCGRPSVQTHTATSGLSAPIAWQGSRIVHLAQCTADQVCQKEIHGGALKKNRLKIQLPVRIISLFDSTIHIGAIQVSTFSNSENPTSAIGYITLRSHNGALPAMRP